MADMARYPHEAPSTAGAAPLARTTAPGPAASAFEASWALLEQGKYTRAEASFAAWLDAHGDPATDRTGQAWFWLGYCREKLGRADEARRAYRTAAESFPASTAAARARKRLGQLPPP